MAEAHRLSPNSAVIGIAQVAVHWFCGDTTRARAVLRSVEQRPDARRSTIYIAMAHAGMGQLDSAFAWLAREDRWGMVDRFELRTSAWLKPLRSDPRYPGMLRAVGLR